MRPSRHSFPNNGGGSHYSPQQHQHHHHNNTNNQFHHHQQQQHHHHQPYQQQQRRFGGGPRNNDLWPPVGANRGFVAANGWGNAPYAAGPMPLNPGFPQQHVVPFGAPGFMPPPPPPQQQQQRHSSYNVARNNNYNNNNNNDGGVGGGGRRHDSLSGPSGSCSFDSTSSRARSLSPPLPAEEAHVRDLARAVDRDIIQRNRQLSLIWSKAHSDALDNLLKAADRAELPASKKRAVDPLLKGFALLTDCRKEGRLDPSQKGRSGDLKEEFVNFIYDLCEDGSDHVRKLGYAAMRHLSRSDPMLLKRNADVLVQLLQNEEPTEHDLIAQSLVGHLEQSPIEAFDVIIQDHAKGELRYLALSFLASPQAEKAMEDKVVGNAQHEAALALRLADVIPLANDEEMELIKVLLRPLSTLWLPSFDFATTEEYENASTSASRLLVKLVEGFLVRFRRAGGGNGSGDGSGMLRDQSRVIEEVLSGSELLSTDSGSEMQDAHQLFKDLLEVSTFEPASDAASGASPAVVYVKDAQKAQRFVHKFLSDSTDAATAPTLLRHLGAPLRILVLRFAAEVTAKVAVAADRAPVEAQWSGQESKQRLARAAINAINAIFPDDAHIPLDTPSATQAYDILVAEALLMVLVHAAPPIRSTGQALHPQLEEQGFKDRLRYLYGASQVIKSGWQGEGQGSVREAGKSVFDIAREYLKPRHLWNNIAIRPTWFTAPPVFPPPASAKEETKKRGRDADDDADKRAATRSERESEKRSRPSDSGAAPPSKRPPPPAPRGRGTTQAPPIASSDSVWDEDDLFPPRSLPLASRSSTGNETPKGLSIRGAAASERTKSNPSSPAPTAEQAERGLSILGTARDKGREKGAAERREAKKGEARGERREARQGEGRAERWGNGRGQRR
ncbi:hypothetical protein ACQY0O_001747 [Thecaphora frezii]